METATAACSLGLLHQGKGLACLPTRLSRAVSTCAFRHTRTARERGGGREREGGSERENKRERGRERGRKRGRVKVEREREGEREKAKGAMCQNSARACCLTEQPPSGEADQCMRSDRPCVISWHSLVRFLCFTANAAAAVHSTRNRGKFEHEVKIWVDGAPEDDENETLIPILEDPCKNALPLGQRIAKITAPLGAPKLVCLPIGLASHFWVESSSR